MMRKVKRKGHCIRKLLLLLPNSRSASGRCDVIGNYSLSKTKKNKVYLDDDDNACRKPEYFRIQYIPPKINFPDDINNYRQVITRSTSSVNETGSNCPDASVKNKGSYIKGFTKSSPKSLLWESHPSNQRLKRKGLQGDRRICIEDSKNGANVEEIGTEEVEIVVSCPAEMDNKSVNEIVDDRQKRWISQPIEKDSKQILISRDSPANETPSLIDHIGGLRSMDSIADQYNEKKMKRRGSGSNCPVIIESKCQGPETDNVKVNQAANVFKSLFDPVRSQSMIPEYGLDSRRNVEDSKITKTKDRAQLSNLPSGLNLKSFRDITIACTSSSTFEHVAESKKYMVPSENIKVIKETINKKRRQLLGQQPWLMGRLALSKESARFQLPMDLRIMEGLSPMEYLTGYCVISSRRMSLYKSTFQRFDKDRDGRLSFKDLIKALRNLHVNFINENELDELCQMLSLDDSSNASYDKSMFASVAAFSERLIIHMRKINKKPGGFGNHLGVLERADFYNIKGKLKDIHVCPALMNILQVLRG